MPTHLEGTRAGPFAGVLIADLTHALSGPFCTMLLAELGARVVKVERPPAGDVSRAFAPVVKGQSAFFAAVNRGKESIALDIEVPTDRDLFRNLVRRADVVVENFRPGTLERHGIDYDALRELNPRIILASISGFGSTGPDSWEGAYDTVGVPALATDARFAGTSDRVTNRDALRSALEAVLAAHSAAEWVDKIQHAGVACGLINTIAQAAEDPQTKARNMILQAGGVRMAGNPIKMNTLPDPPERPAAPTLDADGPAIRRELAAGSEG